MQKSFGQHPDLHLKHARAASQAVDTSNGSADDDADMPDEPMPFDEEDTRMSLEPAEQSGYPADADADEEAEGAGFDEGDEETPDGSSGDGSGSSHTENDQPADGMNMQKGGHDIEDIMVAAKKQSKRKEGAWLRVQHQPDNLDDSMAEIDID